MNQVMDPLPGYLRESATKIRNLVSGASYEIGRELIAMKGKCKHGQWLPYLDEAGIKPRTAQRMIAYTRAIDADPGIDPGKPLPPVSAVLGKYDNLSYLENDKPDGMIDLVEQNIELAGAFLEHTEGTENYRAALLLWGEHTRPTFDCFCEFMEIGRRPYADVDDTELAEAYREMAQKIIACTERTLAVMGPILSIEK